MSGAGAAKTGATPRPIIDPVVRRVCGRAADRLRRITDGGLHEVYRAEWREHPPVIVRIARRPVPWFTDVIARHVGA